MSILAIRGATTVESNTKEEILKMPSDTLASVRVLEVFKTLEL